MSNDHRSIEQLKDLLPVHQHRSIEEQANGADEGVTKPSNPKDIVGSRKGPLELVPDTIEVMAVEAFLEGALKYGRYNWRICGVRASIYYAAAKRHLKKWWNGQDADPITRVGHLKSVLACVGIMLDAELYGKLEDDRPPCPDPDAFARMLDALEAQVAHLKSVFSKENPRQYTIKDTRKPAVAPETPPALSSLHKSSCPGCGSIPGSAHAVGCTGVGI